MIHYKFEPGDLFVERCYILETRIEHELKLIIGISNNIAFSLTANGIVQDALSTLEYRNRGSALCIVRSCRNRQ